MKQLGLIDLGQDASAKELGILAQTTLQYLGYIVPAQGCFSDRMRQYLWYFTLRYGI